MSSSWRSRDQVTETTPGPTTFDLLMMKLALALYWNLDHGSTSPKWSGVGLLSPLLKSGTRRMLILFCST